VADSDTESDGVFAIDALSDSEISTVPDLLTLSSGDDTEERLNFAISDEDWFSEVDEEDLPSPSDWETEPAAPSSGSDTDSFIKLYDSGSTCLISPYKEHFETLSDIPNVHWNPSVTELISCEGEEGETDAPNMMISTHLPRTLVASPQVMVEEEGMFEGEGATEQLMALLEDDDPAELAMSLAQFTADTEVLEPTSLADGPRWEEGIHEKPTSDEVIYMCQPPRFESKDHPYHVCQLQKTLYGLKQSSCRWYQKFVEILVEKIGLTQCDIDQAVFFS